MSLCRRTVIEIISPIDKTPLPQQNISISSAIQVYMKWEGVAPGSACPIEGCSGFSFFNCSSVLKHPFGPNHPHGTFGELFIVVNFTSVLQDAGFENGSPESTRAFAINLSLESEHVRTTDDFWCAKLIMDPPFLLLPNVRLWATLAMTTEQIIANKNSAALGISKVGCDAHSSTSLIMFLVSNSVYFQYR